jgi:hypothetical protein
VCYKFKIQEEFHYFWLGCLPRETSVSARLRWLGFLPGETSFLARLRWLGFLPREREREGERARDG